MPSLKDAFSADLATKPEKHKYQFREGTPAGPIKGETVNGETTWYQLPKEGIAAPGVGASGSAPLDPNFALYQQLKAFKETGLKFTNKNLKRFGIDMTKKQAQEMFRGGQQKEKEGSWGGEQLVPGWMGGDPSGRVDWSGGARDALNASGMPAQFALMQQYAGNDNKLQGKEWQALRNDPAWAAAAGTNMARGGANQMLRNWNGVGGSAGIAPGAPGCGAPDSQGARAFDSFHFLATSDDKSADPSGSGSMALAAMVAPVGRRGRAQGRLGGTRLRGGRARDRRASRSGGR